MPTVIDSLVVLLGLDPTEYKKGEAEAAKATAGTAATVTTAQKKQATTRKKIEDEQAKRAKQLGDEEKKRADATVKGFKDIAVGAGALLLGFDSLKGFISLLGSLNTGEANLGRAAGNLGVDAHALQSWGLAAERIGGKAEDVQGSVANLSKSLTDLNVRGTVSPLIQLMQQLGAQTRGVTDKTKALLDLGDKLRSYAQRHGRDNAFNIAAGAGIDATTFNLITADNSREQLAAAEKQAYANDASIKAAQATQDKIEKLKQRGKAVVADIGHTIVPAVVDTVDKSMTATGFQLEGLNALAHGDITKGISLFRSSAQEHGGVEYDPTALHAALARAEEYNGIPKGVLDTIAFQESRFRPDIIDGTTKSKKGNVGLMQLDPKQWADAGMDTYRDIDRAAVELKTLAKHYGGDYLKAAEAYNWGRGNLDHYLRGDINAKTGKPYEMPKETRDYGAAMAAYLAKSGVTATPDASRVTGKIDRTAAAPVTNVDIGHVTVVTQATDGAGTAAAFTKGAIVRQVSIAQANTGQTQ